MQQRFTSPHDYENLPSLLAQYKVTKLLVVQGKSKKYPPFQTRLETLSLPVLTFSQFSSNPTTEEVEKGIALLQKEGCDGILAVGGGSAIDVAKGIKAFATLSPPFDFHQITHPCSLPLFALPTTAGTGSESTDFAVVYENHVKLSLYHPELLPNVVILEANFLLTLPLYQKKCTSLDALCQGIESYWSRQTTVESQSLAKQGIHSILTHWEGYLQNNPEDLQGVLLGANLCGQAIQKTKTTAPHAMSYGITSYCHVPHGHAVSLTLPPVWQWMRDNPLHWEKTSPSLHDILEELELILTFPQGKGCQGFTDFVTDLQLPSLPCPSEDLFALLSSSVNPQRLSNHPVFLSQETLDACYREIFKQ